MNITDYIDSLPTHRNENYLYTDAFEAMQNIDTIVNASIDATGIGGSIIGSVKPIAESSKIESGIANELICLNTAAVDDILNVEFNDQNIQPVSINLSSNGGQNVLAQSRVDIVVKANSDGQLILNTNQLQSAANCVLKIEIEKDAKFDIVYLQTEKNENPVFVSTLIDVAENAKVTVSTININTAFVRNNLQVNLNGEHSELKAYGISKVVGNEHIDNTMWVNHVVPNCTSEELYKSIVADSAVSAFSGRIVVAPNAQKTSAQQTCRNMLLSADAHAYAKPQLEIYADDVKCSHGATSGQIDKAQLFYMQQRGIDIATAQQLLTAAFALEVVDKIPISNIQTEITRLLTE